MTSEVLTVTCKEPGCGLTFAAPVRLDAQFLAAPEHVVTYYRCPHCRVIHSYKKADHILPAEPGVPKQQTDAGRL